VVAATAAGLLSLAAPAQAAQGDIQVGVNPASTNLTVADEAATIVVAPKNVGSAVADGVRLTIDVPLENVGIRIQNAPQGCIPAGTNRLVCTIARLAPGEVASLSIRVSPPQQSNLRPDEQRTGQGSVVVANDDQTKSFSVTLRGKAAQPESQTVGEVAGNVVDLATSQAIGDTTVRLVDAAGRTHETTTDSGGSFQFTGGTGANAIAPGSETISASKTGYTNQNLSKKVTAKAGEKVNVRLQLKATAVPSASAVVPSGDAVAPPVTEAPSVDATTPAATRKASSQGGLFSWTLIALGGLLVLLGIGSIVLLVVRRRDDHDSDDDRDTAAGAASGPRLAPVPPGAGGRGASPDWPADRTMVAGSGGIANSNDATAMLEPQPQFDEFPDPYNPPRPPSPVGAPALSAAREEVDRPEAPYFAPSRYGSSERGAPDDDDGYGAPTGFFATGDADRTSRYDERTGGRDHGQRGYDDQDDDDFGAPRAGGYGRPQQRDGGHDPDPDPRGSDNGYAQPSGRPMQGRAGRRLEWLDD
jgi:hypothetical protein